VKRGSVALIATVLALASVVGCDSPGDQRPSPPTNSNKYREPLLHDKGLRPVRMASGRALTYVLQTTAAQVLCQSLTKDQWKHLLGDTVGRQPGDGCMINDERGMVILDLVKGSEAFTGETTIAGRPATVEQDDVSGLSVTVALTDDALAPARPGGRPNWPLLSLRSSDHGDSRTELDLAMRVLGEVVPVLAEDGDSLPAIDDTGRIAYVATPLTPGADFVDLPTPVQALQLCTVLIEEALVPAASTEVTAADNGWCEVPATGATVSMDDAAEPVSTYPDRIAGRPAKPGTGGPGSVLVRLRDDALVDLSVTGQDSTALAERLIPLLAG
jgi:hypothetical protein